MGAIYKITNKKNNKCYIGKTEGDPIFRWQTHVYNSKYFQYHLYKAMRLYGLECFTFEILEQDINNPQFLNEREKYWIQYYDSYKNGYNETEGGDGVCKYNYENIVEKYKECNSLSETAIFFNCSEATVRRALKGANLYTNQNNKLFAKPVQQFHLSKDELLNTFESLNQAAKAVNGHPNEIRQACVKNISQAYGFRWKFVDDNEELATAHLKTKKVAKIDIKTDEILEIYDSIAEAAKANSCDASSISKVCKGIRQTCHGYKWQFTI